METKIDQAVLTVELEIEELEAKRAPDGGETVLPLAPIRHHH
jgi:hypothetical protein